MKKRFWAFALMVVMLISIFPVNVLAEENAAPGHKQKLEVGNLTYEGGVLPIFHAYEDGNKLTLYCFNSELHWPGYASDVTDDFYVPDDLLHLKEPVKEKIYRIMYAGYPHNNLGLFVDEKKEATYEDLEKAVNPPDALKTKMKAEGWEEIEFSVQNILDHNKDAFKAIEGFYQKRSDPTYVDLMLDNPDFLFILNYWEAIYYIENKEDLLEFYNENNSKSGNGYFHDATQYAIWRILYENKVPNNGKSFDSVLSTNPLVKQLVDFANGVGPYANVTIPPRDITIEKINEYKTEFLKGDMLLREDNTPVGTDGTIVFTQTKANEYVSEPLHLDSKHTYTFKHTISLIKDGMQEGASVINYGNGKFSLVYNGDLPPVDDQKKFSVNVSVDDEFPSELYQYINEKDAKGKEQGKDPSYQDMAGVYYQNVDMALNLKTVFREKQESGNLEVKKEVNGYPAEASSKEFEFTVELSDKSINGQYGSMNFVNGVATFTLQGGQSREADNLPVNITYTVTEEDYSGAGFTTEKIGDTGTITKDQTATASFTNTYKAKSVDVTLKGNKTMNGKNLSEGEFSFIITGDKVVGKKTVNNKADGSLDFDTYKFEEAGIYTFVVKEVNDGRDGINYDNTVYNITVTVTDDGSGELKYTITGCAPTGDNINFTNGVGGGDDHDGGGGSGETSITRNGSLTISKNVTGDLGDKNKLFTFHVAFNTDNYYAYTGSKTGVIKNGGTVQLKDGESITINGIPSGVAYAIVESDNAGYRVYKTGDAGIIVADQTLKASFTNTKSSVPQTGDNRHLFIWMGIMAISFIGCIISLVFTIRKRESHE